jgi:hypothetical protein
MKKIVLLSIIVCFMVSCATQQPNCGSKSQKKSKYNSMKRGTSPGGNMLH